MACVNVFSDQMSWVVINTGRELTALVPMAEVREWTVVGLERMSCW